MPLYEYECDSCKARVEKFLPLSEFDCAQQCSCGEILRKRLSAPVVFVDYPAYQCPVTGATIEGRRQHEENLKRHGCRVWEPGETDRVRQERVAADHDFGRKVEATIDEQLTTMPSRKREKLVEELKSGADLALVRS